MKTNRKTQDFDENRACIHPTTKKVVTRTGNTCPAGYTSLYSFYGMKGHNGTDWATWHGEPLYFGGSAKTKWYAKNEVDRVGGMGVDIVSDKPLIDGKRVKLRYWHLKVPAVWDGKEIKTGDLIGYSDSTGASSGDHLHEGLKLVDKNGNTIGKTNGYYGAIDPRPYMENTFVLDWLKVEAQALSAIAQARKLIFQIKALLSKRKLV